MTAPLASPAAALDEIDERTYRVCLFLAAALAWDLRRRSPEAALP